MYNGHDSFSYTSLKCHYTISLLLLLQWIHSKDALRHRAAYIQWRTHTLTTISTTLSEKNVHMKTWCTGEYMTKLIRTCWNGTSSDTSACSMFLLWPWRKKKNAQIQSSEAWSATIYIIFFHNARQINCENRMMLHFSVSIKQHKEKKLVIIIIMEMFFAPKAHHRNDHRHCQISELNYYYIIIIAFQNII